MWDGTKMFQLCLTFLPHVLLVDVEQNAAVAAAHHQQGDNIQREEVEHVVDRLLPAAAEAPVSCTLSEVHGLHSDGPEDDELGGQTSGKDWLY